MEEAALLHVSMCPVRMVRCQEEQAKCDGDGASKSIQEHPTLWKILLKMLKIQDNARSWATC